MTSDVEASKICRSLNYRNGILTNDTSMLSIKKPVTTALDEFFIIKINERVFLSMRQDRPLVTLVEAQPPCYRIFVQCA